MVVTVAQRKARKLEHLRAASRAVIAELTAYAQERSGRYLVFGSVARGDERFDSDLDVLVDFPEPAEREARDFAEASCRRHDVLPDIHLRSEASPALMKRVARDAMALP